MSTATAKIVLDSISPEGIRLPTIQLRYPRMVHGEFLTHRVFSRNGRSSRAVPFSVLVKEDPYVPHFLQNKPGMIATEEMSAADLIKAKNIWHNAARHCQHAARELADLGVHKQWVNRMLEWFGYIDVLVTSTEWNNFFALRDEAGAQPEIRDLAVAIKEAMDASTPLQLAPGEWHLPYVNYERDRIAVREELGRISEGEVLETLKKVSVARCARLTIAPFDGNASIEKELTRFGKLMVSRPVHASPAEHIATPDTFRRVSTSTLIDGKVVGDSELKWDHEHEHGNFHGWRQFRKQIPHNTVY